LLHAQGAAVDCCVAVDSIYHFPSKLGVLRAVHGCLRVGGTFACSDMLLQEVRAVRCRAKAL
jgi:SAM-dependent methyltransferase